MGKNHGKLEQELIFIFVVLCWVLCSGSLIPPTIRRQVLLSQFKENKAETQVVEKPSQGHVDKGVVESGLNSSLGS